MEECAICGCNVHRTGNYAAPNVQGRSHATQHHYVAERFFGRSKNRPNEQREPIFERCPWEQEEQTATFCYECHEELIHNPVFLPEDIQKLHQLVQLRELGEIQKSTDRQKLAGRIQLLHEVIEAGLDTLLRQPDLLSGRQSH